MSPASDQPRNQEPGSSWDPTPGTIAARGTQAIVQPATPENRPSTDPTSAQVQRPIVPEIIQPTLAPQQRRRGWLSGIFGTNRRPEIGSELITSRVQTAPPLPWRGKTQATGQLRNGRIERFVDGQRMPPVPLIWRRGKLFDRHSVIDGDEITVKGRWDCGQIVKVDYIHNLTTGAVAYRTPKTLLFLLLYGVSFWLFSNLVILAGGMRTAWMVFVTTTTTIVTTLLATWVTHIIQKKMITDGKAPAVLYFVLWEILCVSVGTLAYILFRNPVPFVMFALLLAPFGALVTYLASKQASTHSDAIDHRDVS